MDNFAPPIPPQMPSVDPGEPTLPQNLADAVSGSAEPSESPAESHVPEAAAPFTDDDLIGLVAELSSLDLPADLREAYQEDFKNQQMVQFGVRLSGVSEALAKYGIGSGGGALPDWAKVLVGVGALAFGVATCRRKYAPIDVPDAEFANAAAESPDRSDSIV